jgi:hypothetical protein
MKVETIARWLIVALVALAASWLIWFAPRPKSSLDRAQTTFEAGPAGRGYNWPVFHQDNAIAKLKCRDIDSNLRICDISMPSIDPITGERGAWIHQPFACNHSGCGWLSE